MGMDERRIWKIVGEPAATKLEAATQQRGDRNRAIDAFKQKHGAAGAFSYGEQFGGIVLDSDEAPSPWKPLKGRANWFAPDRRTKAGKALAKEIQAINALYDDDDAAASFFDGETWVFTGHFLIKPSYGFIKDTEVCIVTAHRDIKGTPIGGLEEMKLSEFYALQGN